MLLTHEHLFFQGTEVELCSRGVPGNLCSIRGGQDQHEDVVVFAFTGLLPILVPELLLDFNAAGL